jgi:hypothetical protein
MIGLITETWIRNVAGHAPRFKEGRQYLKVTIFGKKHSGDNAIILASADVQVYRRKRRNRVEWYGPKGLTAIVETDAPMEISRINVTFPREIIDAFKRLGVKRDKDVDVEANLPRLLEAGNTATIYFTKPLVTMK